ncbi:MULTISPECIES: hypothetical protein [Metallibacterium]|jgi:hypothetical protein|uniref:hypothetical protein n=1 Tax=Metallibacterium TaxID=1218803 RepID=UPI0026356EF2|nr:MULTISPECIES: hypothetical protein [Metallibacterium]MBW8074142.1 hypothetical protein [Metallibacterium scheffleri]
MSAASTVEGFRLFRPEALDAQRQALLGRVLINTPLAHWMVAVTAAALVAGLFGFLWFAQYTPRIQARGELIAASLPAGHMLDAQLLVPAGAIAAVRPGLPVLLHYDVYPYMDLRQRGTVARIDPVPVIGAEASTPGTAPGAAFYRVVVRLLPSAVRGTPGAALKPGIALRGQIALPRRRLLAWLVHGDDAQPDAPRVAPQRAGTAVP